MPPVCRCRPSGSAARRSAVATATSTSASSRAPSATRSTWASTCSTPPRPTASARRRRRSGARCAAAATRPSISTKFGTGYQDRPNFRDGRAERVHVVDRRQPAAPRHRPRRRLHRPLARSRDAVRGDPGCARRAGARGQGALRRRLELHRRRARGVHEDAARRRRAVRPRPVRPADGARDPARTARSTTSRSSATARSPTGS